MMIELHVNSFEKVKEFYGRLGFHVVWERPPEEFKGYLVIKLEDNIICFWCGLSDVGQHPYFKNFHHDTPKGYGVELVIETQSMDAIYDDVKDESFVVEKMELKPWGLRDFRIIDPFGFYLRITTPHDILSNEWAVP